MTIQTITGFFPVVSNKADSLLIASSSFERRCLGFAAHLGQHAGDYRANIVLMIKYSDRGDTAIRSRASRYAPQLRTLLERVAVGKRVEDQDLEPYGLIDGFQFFTGLFERVPVGSSVVVDISTLTKLHLLYLIEAAARSGRVQSLRIAYCRARYGRYDTLSWGAEEPVVLPGFGAPRRTYEQREHLVIFCGLEPDRCYSIWRQFGQGRCTKIFIGTGDEDLDKCAERAQKLNSFVPQSDTITLPPFQTQQTLRELQRLYAESIQRNEYLYIAPMTTKWEIAAVWEFFNAVGRSANAGVVYAAPGRLNASGHTRDDLGECFEASLW
jgi:hypothetical protein